MNNANCIFSVIDMASTPLIYEDKSSPDNLRTPEPLFSISCFSKYIKCIVI